MSRWVPPARWYQCINTASTSTAYPTGTANGVLVPQGMKGEYAHLLVDANAGGSYAVIGLTSSKGDDAIGNKWARLETYAVTGDTDTPWAEPLVSVTAYERIQVQRTDTNANCTANAYIGFCEHWRGR